MATNLLSTHLRFPFPFSQYLNGQGTFGFTSFTSQDTAMDIQSYSPVKISGKATQSSNCQVFTLVFIFEITAHLHTL